MKFRILTCIAFICAVGLAGCGAGSQTPGAPISASPSAAAPLPSDTPPPTPTPTPPPGRLVLVAPQGSADPLLGTFLSDEAQKAGLVFDQREALQPSDLGPDARIVLLLVQPANLTDLLAAAPQAQFSVVAPESLEPGPNLTVIRASAVQQAFAAGFTAALLSDDWRAGGLISADAPQLQQAFKNGAGYFCGDCAPGWPQQVKFPLLSAVGSSGDGAAWAASAQEMFENGKAEIFYLANEASRDEVYAVLAGKIQVAREVKVIGAGAPPAALKGQWAATLGLDSLEAIKKALPEMLAGRSAGTLDAPVLLSQVDPDLLSPGRLDLIKKVLVDLASGQINPLSVP